MEYLYSESYDDLLKRLITAVPEIKAAILVTPEGLPLSSFLPEEMDEITIAGITTALILMSKEFIKTLKNCKFKQVSLNAFGGYVIGVQASEDKLLMVLATEYTKLNSILKDLWDIE